MIEVYTKNHKRFAKFNSVDVRAVKRRLQQLNIINAIKYLVVISYEKVCVYYCTSCHKRTYINYPLVKDAICAHCNKSNHLFFIIFKHSKKQKKVTYAI